MKKRNLLLAVTFLAFCIIAGPISLNASEILGAWKAQNPDIPNSVVTFTFSADNTYEIKVELIDATEPAEMLNNSYEVSDSTIKFTDVDTSCGDVVGEYTFKVEDNVLSFDPVNDECESRKDVLSSWKFEKVE